ncbi:MAG TPA: hypothetical protein VIJ94_07455 [Caulobacteraceae bacterium]
MKRPGLRPAAAPIALTALLICASLMTGAPAAEPPAQASSPASCASSGELMFVCRAHNPEDLARIPGTHWLIATGFAPGGGLSLIDTKARQLSRWAAEPGADAAGTRTPCRSPPDPALFNAHGLSLRRTGDGRFSLHVVNHGGRESVEVFEVDARPARPTLTWTSCVPMPPGLAANSVATFADGTVLVSVLTRPGTGIADFVQGKITGGVYQWRPGDTGFTLMPGTELPGNNGLETSRDGRQFYVVAFGWHAVVVYDRNDTTSPRLRAVAPDFMPDNIHWDGERLIAAGMRYDEPACGGPRGLIDGAADPMTCHRGYVAATFDPGTGAFRTLAYGPPNAAFNDVSSAVVVGDELWMGAYRSDRLAWRRLPGPAPH